VPLLFTLPAVVESLPVMPVDNEEPAVVAEVPDGLVPVADDAEAPVADWLVAP